MWYLYGKWEAMPIKEYDDIRLAVFFTWIVLAIIGLLWAFQNIPPEAILPAEAL